MTLSSGVTLPRFEVQPAQTVTGLWDDTELDLSELINQLYHHSAFHWGGVAGRTWSDWSAMGHVFAPTPLRDQLRAELLDWPVTDDGCPWNWAFGVGY